MTIATLGIKNLSCSGFCDEGCNTEDCRRVRLIGEEYCLPGTVSLNPVPRSIIVGSESLDILLSTLAEFN